MVPHGDSARPPRAGREACGALLSGHHDLVHSAGGHVVGTRDPPDVAGAARRPEARGREPTDLPGAGRASSRCRAGRRDPCAHQPESPGVGGAEEHAAWPLRSPRPPCPACAGSPGAAWAWEGAGGNGPQAVDAPGGTREGPPLVSWGGGRPPGLAPAEDGDVGPVRPTGSAADGRQRARAARGRGGALARGLPPGVP